MAVFKVAVTDSVFPNLDTERTILAREGAEIAASQCGSVADAVALVQGAHAVLNGYFKPVGPEVMDAMPDCRIIVRYGIGLDSVDIPAATARGIAVANVPDYCIAEVSDHAVAMTLSLLRKLPLSDRRVRAGDWDLKPIAPLKRLSTLTAGIVGMGRIGRAIAVKLAPFGFRIIFHDPFFTGEPPVPAARAVGLEELFAESDAIILQTPLTADTRHLLDDDAFAAMGRQPVIVNCARGELIDTAALVRALETGRISGAGLDVIENAPPLAVDHPLMRCDNVILAPHSAWMSTTALTDLQRLAAEEVARALRGERPKVLANPEVWPQVRWKQPGA
jgi:D-3-phosphoglycerate dehydrogenase